MSHQEQQNVGIFPSRILLALGGSDDADLVTRKAVELADSTGSELHLVHVGKLPNFLMKDVDTIGFDRTLYEEIVNLARDSEADLIVIGNRGHGGLRRAIEGSISEYVVRHAHCPVMIVRVDNNKKRKGFWRRAFSSGSTNSG